MSTTFLRARWRYLLMANYAVDPSVLQPHLPAGTRLDFFGGKTYVSLVGFLFEKTRLFGVPVPFYGDFEEVNLRFYVVGEEDGQHRRGVVFINETVPFRAVATLANLLYSEHYSTRRMSHEIQRSESGFRIGYKWAGRQRGQKLWAEAGENLRPMAPGGKEEFIFEHYYGYTRISDTVSERYRVVHPSWQVYDVRDYGVECDFGEMYGDRFAHLTGKSPDSVFLAHGSDVRVEWKRFRFRVGK
jgi:uncharacterized protein YqjF (DUF2071 family)